ncbi:endonuclease/exonuclease/phosphatase family protein [Ramlibacter sp. B156]|uniref:Endonuclease/exonuclease/phosphatase family protein n=2 Tax=Ramlibacter montanisoli TaxID=2732512 RepID=A0A849KBC6_9BURK|nr:endonuclease/exonuclease/phosphatase family protein [Ramlibacter montanisoli]
MSDLSLPMTPATEQKVVAAQLTVMTVNIHKGFTTFNRRFILPELRDAVRKVGADLVFMQEVLGMHDAHGKKWEDWPEGGQYEFLADSIWPQFAYGRNMVYPKGHHGNAVMSKFPIVHYQNHDVSVAGPEKRGLLHCVLKVPNCTHDVHAICVHLGLAESHRQQQLDLLCKITHTEVPAEAPLIVAGDFNDWRRRANEILLREAGLREIFVTAYGEPAKTFPAIFPVLSLDRIYVRNCSVHLPVVLPRKPWSHLSDHAPLVAEIHL